MSKKIHNGWRENFFFQIFCHFLAFFLQNRHFDPLDTKKGYIFSSDSNLGHHKEQNEKKMVKKEGQKKSKN